MKVYDLWPFFNELDLLELRLAELDPVVDVFGAVEVPRTFTDLPKALYLTEALKSSRFDRWKDKIRVYVPPSYPSGPHPTVDWFQRAQLGKNAHDASADDIILISDVDEIPSREAVDAIKRSNIPLTVLMDLYYHRVDLKDQFAWAGTVGGPLRCFGANFNAQEIRGDRGNFPRMGGGWHFSWLGDAKQIATKLEAVDIERENAIYGSEGIKAPPREFSFLDGCYKHGDDLFRRDRPKKKVPILPGTTHPYTISEWLKKFPRYAG